MRLYFLRHGVAVERPDWRGNDAERPLTEEGKKRMARSAAVLAELDLGLDAILTSPLARARQTADIVASALNARGKLMSESRLGIGFCIEKLAEILCEHAGAGAILLIGHEPGLGETISALIGGGRIICKKGGLACVTLDDRKTLRGELLWLIPPRLLAR